MIWVVIGTSLGTGFGLWAGWTLAHDKFYDLMERQEDE